MICSTCATDRDSALFYFRDKSKGTRAKQCKICANAYRKAHYESNKSAYISRSREWGKTNKAKNAQKLVTFLQSSYCVDCGENDPLVLDLDHKDRDTKSFNVSAMLSTMSWKNIKREIDKCEVRCANCHRRKTAKQLGHIRYFIVHGE